MQKNYFIAIVVFFFMAGTASAQKIQANANQFTKAEIQNVKEQETAYGQLQSDLQKLEQQKATLLELMKKYDEKQKQVVVKMRQLETAYDAIAVPSTDGNSGLRKNSDSQQQLESATKQMQEMQMSFNLQYLQLQSQMQQENRSYTSVSNILKTKHDTAKNSISNVR